MHIMVWLLDLNHWITRGGTGIRGLTRGLATSPQGAMKKCSEATQTLRTGCSKAEPNFFDPSQTPSRGTGWPKFNQLEMVTTFTYKPSLVKIDAHNFELSW